MPLNGSFWSYFIHANLAVKMILLILLGISIISWMLILQKGLLLKQLNNAHSRFENRFWSGIKLTELYHNLPENLPPEQLSAIFYAGFTEFYRLRDSGCKTLSVILESVERAMDIASAHAEINLERHLNGLAIIGSYAPYLGLLGTLLGIMSALSELSHVNQVNALLLIAPGISEALISSVLSLLTTIPAIIFYHRYMNQMDRLLKQYNIFQGEFIALLLRQAYEESYEKTVIS